MKKIFKRKDPAVEPQAEPDIAASIDKMQQQLVSLEKKIDTLISSASGRPFEKKNYGEPFQRFDNSYRHDRGNRGNSFRERKFTKTICADCKSECEVPFIPSGGRPVYCKECFAKRKNDGSSFKAKFEHSPREETPAGNRRFDKPRGKGSSRPGGRKKPAFRKRRERA